MKPRLNLTPAQLVLVSLFGFVISAASFPLTRFARTPPGGDGTRWIPALLVIGLFLIGLVVSTSTSSVLKKGIRNQQWPEAQIEPLRSWLESPLFNVLPITLIVAYCILWLVFPKYRLIGLACFTLMQVLSQLRTAVHRPPAKPSSLIVGWRDYPAPIHSDQWGQR